MPILRPAASIVRTRLGSPSKLATFRVCPLRYVLETEKAGASPISAHPATLLGTAVHNAAESLLGEVTTDTINYVELVESNFTKLVSEKDRGSPMVTWVIERFGLAGLISRRQMLEQAAFAKSLTERFSLAGGRVSGASKEKSGSIPLGSEKWLESTCLGIGGRVDLLNKDPDGSIRIVDFKTGKVIDEQGKPKIAYLLQLAAYGRIVKEIDPRVTVMLELLGKSDQWLGIFDDRLKFLVDSALHELNTELPIGTAFTPRALSRTGEHCSQCSHRPSCEAYNDELDKRMARGVFDYDVSPLDISGKLMEVTTEGDLSTIRCKLENGCTVKIVRIPSALSSEIFALEGQSIRAYALRTLETRRSGGFPCNFFVIDLETPRNSAFQAFFQTHG